MAKDFEARLRLGIRIKELNVRLTELRKNNDLQFGRVDWLIKEALITGFVCALSIEELQLLAQAVRLDYGVDQAKLDGEIVKAVLEIEVKGV